MKLRLDLRLSQKLVMTPQLQQAIKLLQLSRLELQQVLTQQLMENPVLEEALTDAEDGEAGIEEGYIERSKGIEQAENPTEVSTTEKAEESEPSEELSSTDWEEYFDSERRVGDTEYPSSHDDDFPSYEQTLTKATSLEEHLLWQLRVSALSAEEKSVGEMLIGNLDEEGYLRIPLEEIATDIHVPIEHVERVLESIQSFDPTGVGARNLQECLLIQVRHLAGDPMGWGATGVCSGRQAILESIIANHLHDLEKRRYDRIARMLDMSVEDVYEAVRVIEGLEPKPGRPYFETDNQAIVPDVFVVKNDDEWVVLLNDDGLPRLRISSYYKRFMNVQEGSDATKLYLEEKMRNAQWLVRSIEQRNKTIVKVVKSIVKFQDQFFEKGIQFLKPLVLKQVADDIGMHESTVSRVTANKYMHCPQGILKLKYFFNPGIQRSDQQTDELSSATVREMIREVVAQEDALHPLKDQEIVALLRRRQIRIARRTVAKYRAEVNIPSASQRKRVF